MGKKTWLQCVRVVMKKWLKCVRIAIKDFKLKAKEAENRVGKHEDTDAKR